MEVALIVVGALFVLLVVGGALLAPSRRRDSVLEPPIVEDPNIGVTEKPRIEVDEESRPAVDIEAEPQIIPQPDVEPEPAPTFRGRLGKARGLLGEYVGALRGKDKIDATTWDDLEEALIRADVGVATTTNLLDELKVRVKEDKIKTPNELIDSLKADLKMRLAKGDRSLALDEVGPNVWLFVGVNGVGKTTTIGKVALRESQAGRSVVMAAGDTFRAAAAEQLTVWAERADSEVVRGQEGGDPGAVIFDAIERAKARNVDLVLADTAGRLQNKFNLMEELKKIKRITEREPAKLQEVLLVLDATTGQNGMSQAKQFSEAVQCTGVVLTKLDGSAKGGIALAIQEEFGIPIKLVGLGESNRDLIEFDPDSFVDALFD